MRGLRCAACHDLPDALPAPPAPSLASPARQYLARLANELDWRSRGLITTQSQTTPPRRTRSPNHNTTRLAAKIKRSTTLSFACRGWDSIARTRSTSLAFLDPADAKTASQKATDANVPKDEDADDDVSAGKELFFTLGCLACHGMENVGSTRLSGGGDLSAVGSKRPAEFFSRWLTDPASSNPTHRMPVFLLEPDEREQLAAYLTTKGAPLAAPQDFARSTSGDRQRGIELVATHRCGACHQLPEPEAPSRAGRVGEAEIELPKRLGEKLPGGTRCRASAPGYRLRPEQRRAIVDYIAAIAGATPPHDVQSPLAGANSAGKPTVADGARLFAERKLFGLPQPRPGGRHCRAFAGGRSSTSRAGGEPAGDVPSFAGRCRR